MNEYIVTVTINASDQKDAEQIVERGIDKQGLVVIDMARGWPRHPEDRLCGIVEAALNRLAGNEEWLQELANDTEFGITQSTPDEVFRAIESYITDHLARIT